MSASRWRPRTAFSLSCVPVLLHTRSLCLTSRASSCGVNSSMPGAVWLCSVAPWWVFREVCGRLIPSKVAERLVGLLNILDVLMFEEAEADLTDKLPKYMGLLVEHIDCWEHRNDIGHWRHEMVGTALRMLQAHQGSGIMVGLCRMVAYILKYFRDNEKSAKGLLTELGKVVISMVAQGSPGLLEVLNALDDLFDDFGWNTSQIAFFFPVGLAVVYCPTIDAECTCAGLILFGRALHRAEPSETYRKELWEGGLVSRVLDLTRQFYDETLAVDFALVVLEKFVADQVPDGEASEISLRFLNLVIDSIQVAVWAFDAYGGHDFIILSAISIVARTIVVPAGLDIFLSSDWTRILLAAPLALEREAALPEDPLKLIHYLVVAQGIAIAGKEQDLLQATCGALGCVGRIRDSFWLEWSDNGVRAVMGGFEVLEQLLGVSEDLAIRHRSEVVEAVFCIVNPSTDIRAICIAGLQCLIRVVHAVLTEDDYSRCLSVICQVLRRGTFGVDVSSLCLRLFLQVCEFRADECTKICECYRECSDLVEAAAISVTSGGTAGPAPDAPTLSDAERVLQRLAMFKENVGSIVRSDC